MEDMIDDFNVMRAIEQLRSARTILIDSGEEPDIVKAIDKALALLESIQQSPPQRVH